MKPLAERSECAAYLALQDGEVAKQIKSLLMDMYEQGYRAGVEDVLRGLVESKRDDETSKG